MSDAELLEVAERTLNNAIHEAEFTRLEKDAQYCNEISKRIEALRAKISNMPIIEKRYFFENNRLMVETKIDNPFQRRM